MIRNSGTPTPRSSPPVTRSSSKVSQIAANRRVSLVSRTCEVMETPPASGRRRFGRVEDDIVRHHEVADDEEEALEVEDDLNTSRFIYKEHFTKKERCEMFFADFFDRLLYRFRTLRRQSCPSWRTIINIMTAVLLSLMISKYARDCYADFYRGNEASIVTDRLDESVARIQEKISDLATRQQILASDFDDFRRTQRDPVDVGTGLTAFSERMGHIEMNLSGMLIEMNNLKTETKLTIEDLGNEIHSSTHKGSVAIREQKTPEKNNVEGVNVANSLIGAKIDDTCSSRSVPAKDSLVGDVMSYVIPSFKAGYVLLDRDLILPGEAWCTKDVHASLTIRLARHIRPTAVSYEHVRWSGVAPPNAPKIFDVVACNSPCCTKWTPIVTRCEYGTVVDGADSLEQICHVQDTTGLEFVNHVQFRFRENHGNSTKTCAYLVRVYGNLVNPPEGQSRPIRTDEVSQSLLSYLPSFLTKQ